MFNESDRSHHQLVHQRLHDHLKEMGAGKDLRGMEISHLIRCLANRYENAINHSAEEDALSGPRLGILLRLMAEEDLGNRSGINPTHLSHMQSVSKNTISSLLRGLEEQGYIAREIDAQDKRAFRIRITPGGRELIQDTTPKRIDFMAHLISGLNDKEKDTLAALLQKLLDSMNPVSGS